MFDTQAAFNLPVVSGGIKEAKCRFPSDEEYAAYRKKLRTKRTAYGRGRSIAEPVNQQQCSKELFDKIRLDPDGEPFDEYDADDYIQRLVAADVKECSRNGEGFYVEMKAAAGLRVKHKLKMPTQKQKAEYEKHHSRGYGTANPNVIEIRYSADEAGPLWDQLKLEVNGYAEGSKVPLSHKQSAVVAIINYIDQMNEEAEVEDESEI